MKIRYWTRIAIVILFSFCTFALIARKSPLEIERATEAYNRGDYREAIAQWKELHRNGYSDPDMFFNIGNAEAMTGNVPQSILSYEKALRYKPGDKNIREAIEAQRNRITDPVSAIQPFFLAEFFTMIFGLLRPWAWAFIGMSSLLVAILLWLNTLGVLKLKRNVDTRYVRILIGTGILTLFFVVMSYSQIYSLHQSIVITECGLLQGPSLQSPLIRTVSAGEKVKMKDQIGEWQKVTLLNLDEGWIKKECLEVIDVRK